MSLIEIKYSDYTEYDSKYCRNGGKYGFTTVYTVVNGEWYAEEYTTAEYCPYCRQWDCSGDCTEHPVKVEKPSFELKKLKEGEEVKWTIRLSEEVEQSLICPQCGQRTKYFVRSNTVAEHLPLYCQRCKTTFDTSYRDGVQTSRYYGTAQDSCAEKSAIDYGGIM